MRRRDLPHTVRRIAVTVLLLMQALAALPLTGTAQVRQPEPAARQRARVSGAVHDSTRGFPVAGAMVQISADDESGFGRTVIADTLGHFGFDDVPSGRYTIGFHHPLLDSLGIEPVSRTISVREPLVHVDLAVPSVARIRRTVCGADARGDPRTLLMGFVRDALTDAPLADAAVRAEWLEYALGKNQLREARAQRTATTAANGWFALCDVPREGYTLLSAAHGRDSTDQIEIQLFNDGFQRRELTVGAARDLTVNGTVRQDNGRPLANASVRLVHGPQTLTNARGEFTIVGAPAGTRLLEVRAVGFYPERQVVQVRAGLAPVRAELASFRSVLDTVKVLANFERYDTFREFRDRQRMGLGFFVTADEIAKRNVTLTSDLFRNMRGVFVDGGAGFDVPITMRGIFTARCSPSLLLNGFPFFHGGEGMPGLSTADIDAVIRSEEIYGIEVYAFGQVPPQFQLGMQACGAIVIWTR